MNIEEIVNKQATKLRIKHQFNELTELECKTFLNEFLEAINFITCCTQLKGEELLSFEDWYMFMDYEKDTYTTFIDKQGVSYFENELRQKYNCYLKHNL